MRPPPCGGAPAASRRLAQLPPLSAAYTGPSSSGAAAAIAAATGCVANPQHPWDSEESWDGEGDYVDLGACRQCDASNTTCLECWGHFSLVANGSCVLW